MRYNIFLCALFCVLCTSIWIASANAYEFPPYEGLKLKITGNISEDYSNNITFANDEEDRVEDFRTMLTLGIDLNYEGKRRSLGLSGAARRRIEFDDSDISNSSEKITVFFNNEFSEYDRIKIDNTFTHTQEPDSFQGFEIEKCREYYEDYGFSTEEIEAECSRFEEEFGRFQGRFDSYKNRVTFAYNKAISQQFNMNTNYSYAQNWSPEEGTQDSQQNAVGASINYSYGPATVFLLSYKYQINDYEDGDDISRQSVSAGIKQYITRRVLFDGSIGGVFVSDHDDSISGNASLTAEIDEQTTGRILYSQGVRINPNEEDIFRNWRLSGMLKKLLSEDLSASFSGFYGKGDFVSADITDTLMGADFALSYEFWRSKRGSRFFGNAGYTYSDLDSTDENRRYTRNSVTASLTLAF